jgi:hypothetical protein
VFPLPVSRRRFLAVVVLACGGLAAASGSVRAEEESQATDKIVVSGASGGLAGEALQELIGRGVPLTDLILVTRTPEKLSSFATNGSEVREGDFSKPETLDSAFAGGKKLLLISTNGGDRVAQHTAAIEAARRAGIRHIVYTSFINATAENPAVVARDHRLTEEALRKSGLGYTILRGSSRRRQTPLRRGTCTRTAARASGRRSPGAIARRLRP